MPAVHSANDSLRGKKQKVGQFRFQTKAALMRFESNNIDFTPNSAKVLATRSTKTAKFGFFWDRPQGGGLKFPESLISQQTLPKIDKSCHGCGLI